MSRSQPGTARAVAAGAHAPAFASQPGTATAAAAASFAPPPELAEHHAASAAGCGREPGAAGAASYGATAAYDTGGAAGAAYDAEGGAGATGAPSAADANAYYGGATTAAGHAEPGTQHHPADDSEQDAVAAGAEGAAQGADAYSPLAYLQQLEAHLGSLQQQRRGLEQQLAAAAAAAYQQMSLQLGTASTGVPVPPDVPALVDELAVLQSVRQYLAYLQELQALTRHAEKSVRALHHHQQQQLAEGAATEGAGSAAAFLHAVAEGVDGFSNTVGYGIAVKQLTGESGQLWFMVMRLRLVHCRTMHGMGREASCGPWRVTLLCRLCDSPSCLLARRHLAACFAWVGQSACRAREGARAAPAAACRGAPAAGGRRAAEPPLCPVGCHTAAAGCHALAPAAHGCQRGWRGGGVGGWRRRRRLARLCCCRGRGARGAATAAGAAADASAGQPARAVQVGGGQNVRRVASSAGLHQARNLR